MSKGPRNVSAIVRHCQRVLNTDGRSVWSTCDGPTKLTTLRRSMCCCEQAEKSEVLSTMVLSVDFWATVRVLWPNGWMDQDETWHGGRLRPRPRHIAFDGFQLPLKGHSPQFSAHVYCTDTDTLLKLTQQTCVNMTVQWQLHTTIQHYSITMWKDTNWQTNA